MQETPEEQYEQTRSPLELHEYWKTSIEKLDKKDFLLRKDRLRRKYFEELPAIVAIGLHWSRPGLDVSIRPHVGSEKFDAEIFIKGWLNLNCKIEVVSTIDHCEQLQRESIFKTGRAGGVASTHRRKSKSSKDIEYEVVTRSDEQTIQEIVDTVVSRIEMKEEKGYTGKYMLGVLFEHYKSLRLTEIKVLSEKLESRMNLRKSSFCEIYLVNSYDLGLIKL